MNKLPIGLAAKVALFAIVVGVLIMVDQWISLGRIQIDWDQIMHHEDFTLFLWCFAVGIVAVIGFSALRARTVLRRL